MNREELDKVIATNPNWYQDKEWKRVNVLQTPEAVYINGEMVYKKPVITKGEMLLSTDWEDE